MKSYNVKEIAEMLNTNPETVRRWIRDKKLVASAVSRKDGNVITDSEFRQFLKANPKYLKNVSLGITSIEGLSSPISMVTVLLAQLLAAQTAGYIEEKNNRDFVSSSKEIENYIHTSIINFEKEIDNKLDSINVLNKEIEEIQIQIRQLEDVLNKLPHDMEE